MKLIGWLLIIVGIVLVVSFCVVIVETDWRWVDAMGSVLSSASLVMSGTVFVLHAKE